MHNSILCFLLVTSSSSRSPSDASHEASSGHPRRCVQTSTVKEQKFVFQLARSTQLCRLLLPLRLISGTSNLTHCFGAVSLARFSQRTCPSGALCSAFRRPLKPFASRPDLTIWSSPRQVQLVVFVTVSGHFTDSPFSLRERHLSRATQLVNCFLQFLSLFPLTAFAAYGRSFQILQKDSSLSFSVSTRQSACALLLHELSDTRGRAAVFHSFPEEASSARREIRHGLPLAFQWTSFGDRCHRGTLRSAEVLGPAGFDFRRTSLSLT
jgi:hypothetical protein